MNRKDRIRQLRELFKDLDRWPMDPGFGPDGKLALMGEHRIQHMSFEQRPVKPLRPVFQLKWGVA